MTRQRTTTLADNKRLESTAIFFHLLAVVCSFALKFLSVAKLEKEIKGSLSSNVHNVVVNLGAKEGQLLRRGSKEMLSERSGETD